VRSVATAGAGGAATGGVTAAPHHPKDGSIVNGWLAFVIDPARFGDMGAFRSEMSALIAHVKASPPADPDQPVLVAGEKERATRAARLAGGIPVDGTTWDILTDTARSLGINAIPAPAPF
jgi:uncharacterized oxidoreductase